MCFTGKRVTGPGGYAASEVIFQSSLAVGSRRSVGLAADRLALVRLDEHVEPVRLQPVAVRRGTQPDSGTLAALLDPSRARTTFPGDEFTLVYELPGDPASWELFLESRGY
jgi:hypothetical protein